MKLTKAKRDIAVSNAIKAAFYNNIKDAKVDFTNKLVQLLDSLKIPRGSSVPKKFIPYITLSSSVRINNAPTNMRNTYVEIPVPFCRDGYSSLRLEWNDVCNFKETKTYFELLDSKSDAEKQLRTVLYSCTTEKQLQETCPELYEFYPKKNDPFHAPVPVETISAVQKLLRGIK